MKTFKQYKHKTSMICLMSGIVFSVAFGIVSNSQAHNKVVVIPMAGDDLTAEPTTPLAKDVPSQSDYTIGIDTVIDNITGLEWQRQDDDTTRDFDEAWDYCAGLTLDSHSDWRLPSVKELLSIVDYGQSSAPRILTAVFTNTNIAPYSTASTLANSSGDMWYVSFGNGRVFITDTTNDLYVRCVR